MVSHKGLGNCKPAIQSTKGCLRLETRVGQGFQTTNPQKALFGLLLPAPPSPRPSVPRTNLMSTSGSSFGLGVKFLTGPDLYVLGLPLTKRLPLSIYYRWLESRWLLPIVSFPPIVGGLQEPGPSHQAKALLLAWIGPNKLPNFAV